MKTATATALLGVVLLGFLQLGLGVPTKNKRQINTPQKIVGGSNARRQEFPHMARLRYSSSSFSSIFCGGTLINSRYVLTAKHCVAGSSASSITVVLGDFSRYSYDSGEQSIRVQQIKLHPQYDIALLLMERSSNYRSAYLADTPPGIGQDVIVSGWGWITQNGGSQSLANVLQKISLKIQAPSACNSEGLGVAGHELCAGKNGGEYMNACHGDSGGPLGYWSGNSWVLAGTVEKGHGGCPNPFQHAVFVSVADPQVRNWILSNDDIPAPATSSGGGGCFPGSALVSLRDGRHMRMSELQIGDEVEATAQDGAIIYSKVLLMFHRDPSKDLVYHMIETADLPEPIAISSYHLIAISKANATSRPSQFVFAKDVSVNDFVMMSNGKNVLPTRVMKISTVYMKGVYAPLTYAGTINVNHVTASCYARFGNHQVAHWSMSPVRWANDLFSLLSISRTTAPQIGKHWYGSVLETISSPFIY